MYYVLVHLLLLLSLVYQCSKIFSTRGYSICLNIFGCSNALRNHQASCLFSCLKSVSCNISYNFFNIIFPTAVYFTDNFKYFDQRLLFRTSCLSILDTSPLDKGGRSCPQVIALACKMVASGHDGKLDVCARVFH